LRLVASDLNVAFDGSGRDLFLLHWGGGGIRDLDALRTLWSPARFLTS
jgi:hypothetical protein